MARGDTPGDIDVLALWGEGEERGEAPSKELQRANSSPKGQVLLLEKQAQPCPVVQPGKMSLQGPGECPQGVAGDTALPDLPPRQDPQNEGSGDPLLPILTQFATFGAQKVDL